MAISLPFLLSFTTLMLLSTLCTIVEVSAAATTQATSTVTKDQVQCQIMCAECENPCQPKPTTSPPAPVIYPPPPPPPSLPPPAVVECPPPPRPLCLGDCEPYPTGQGTYYPPGTYYTPGTPYSNQEPHNYYNHGAKIIMMPLPTLLFFILFGLSYYLFI